MIKRYTFPMTFSDGTTLRVRFDYDTLDLTIEIDPLTCPDEYAFEAEDIAHGLMNPSEDYSHD